MIVLVMGVAGSGKTTIGRMLASRLGWVYLEADDFHSAANKEKMHRGEHLTEADRLPWLRAMHAELQKQSASGKNVVLACSALNEEYRRVLMDGLSVKLVYLRGSKELIASRLRHRTGHFRRRGNSGRPVCGSGRTERCDCRGHCRRAGKNRRGTPFEISLIGDEVIAAKIAACMSARFRK